MNLKNIVSNTRKWFYNRYYKTHPPEMVHYWRWQKDSAMAKMGKAPDGSYQMEIQGEKYPYPGFPRGHLLQKDLSRFKHIIKNRLFNDSWALLEENKPIDEVIKRIKGEVIDEINQMSIGMAYDMMPTDKLCVSVREIHRSLMAIVDQISNEKTKEKLKWLFKGLTWILQEDDAYRFRVQWLVTYFNPSKWYFRLLGRTYKARFKYSLEMLEHAEAIGDMKERIRLLRRILLMMLEDKTIGNLFETLCKEMDWNKLQLTIADKYYFRGKYFKVDFDHYDY